MPDRGDQRTAARRRFWLQQQAPRPHLRPAARNRSRDRIGRGAAGQPAVRSDLFWACQGGGGVNSGINTRFVLRPTPGEGCRSTGSSGTGSTQPPARAALDLMPTARTRCPAASASTLPAAGRWSAAPAAQRVSAPPALRAQHRADGTAAAGAHGRSAVGSAHRGPNVRPGGGAARPGSAQRQLHLEVPYLHRRCRPLGSTPPSAWSSAGRAAPTPPAPERPCSPGAARSAGGRPPRPHRRPRRCVPFPERGHLAEPGQPQVISANLDWPPAVRRAGSIRHGRATRTSRPCAAGLGAAYYEQNLHRLTEVKRRSDPDRGVWFRPGDPPGQLGGH